MLEVAIVEDDVNDMNDLIAALDRFSEETGEAINTYRFTSGGAFLTNADKRVYDVIFLDIELPNCNGMDLAAEIRKIDERVPIIFVTNAVRYAVQGYKVGALDYFLKPVGYYELKLRMEFVRMRHKSVDPTLTISMPGLKKNMPLSRIYYMETRGHALTYHTEEGNYEVSRGESLKNIEKRLTELGFARCSSCYLVNLRWCKEIKGDSVVCGRDGDMLKISRSLKREFLVALSDVIITDGGRK